MGLLAVLKLVNDLCQFHGHLLESDEGVSQDCGPDKAGEEDQGG